MFNDIKTREKTKYQIKEKKRKEKKRKEKKKTQNLMYLLYTAVRPYCIFAVCCGVRGRALASHTDVRGFEPQCGGRLSSLTC